MRTTTAAIAVAAMLTGCGQGTPQTRPPGAAMNPATETTARLKGRVTDGSNTGVAGAFVTAKDRRSGIEVTVYTSRDGEFVLPELPAAAYDIRVHHPAHESVTRQSDTGAPADMDFELAVTADRLSTATTADWMALLPDGDMKREFILNCETCHEITQARIWLGGKPRDAAGWLGAIAMMRGLDAYDVIPPDFDDERYATWLATHLTEEASTALREPVIVDPAIGEGVVITEYPLPEADELPHDLVVGPDGRIWVTAFWHSEMWALDPQTGEVQRYPVAADPAAPAQVRALEFHPDGHLWMVNGGSESLVKLDTGTGAYTTYPVGMYAHDMDIDSRGDIWVNDYFSKPERIGRVDQTTGEVSYFGLPSANLPDAEGKPLPYGMLIDAQDRLWSTQLAANTLVRFDIATGDSRLYQMPHPNSGPRRHAIAPDGGVWIPEFNAGRLVRFDPGSETFASVDLGDSAAGAYDVEVDPRDGSVWIGASLRNSLMHYDPKTKRLTEYPLPTAPAYMRHLAVDPRNGDVWSAYSSLPTAVPKVVRLRRNP